MGWATGSLALAACAAPQSSGVVPVGQDLHGIRVTGSNLAKAAETGLAEAAAFCGTTSRQARFMQSRITDAEYQLVFRCAEGPPVTMAQQPIPVLGVASPAFPPHTSPTIASGQLAVQGAPIYPVNAPMLAPPAAASPPPAPQSTATRALPSLATSASWIRQASAPLPASGASTSGEPARPGFLTRLFGAEQPPQQRPLPSLNDLGTSVEAPRSPLMPGAPDRLPPLGSQVPLPVAAPTVNGASSARNLPPAPLQPLPRLNAGAVNIPPPALTSGGTATISQPVSAEPPSGFWQTPRS
jgi:hypothetical protein